jgi:hypothetical protein
MTDSLFFNIPDILATEEKVNAEFNLDCFNLESLEYLCVILDPDSPPNTNKIMDEIEDQT